jgi:hypothetical protein
MGLSGNHTYSHGISRARNHTLELVLAVDRCCRVGLCGLEME